MGRIWAMRADRQLRFFSLHILGHLFYRYHVLTAHIAFGPMHVPYSDNRVTKSQGKSRDNWRKHHLKSNFIDQFLFCFLSHCMASIITYSYC